MLPALFVVCAQAWAAQGDATGEPAVTAADGTDLTMVGPNEDNALTATQGTIDDDPDGLAVFTPTWQWSAADSSTDTYTDITDTTATAATFTPLQAHVGKFLRVCASFKDDAENDEERCLQIGRAVVNVDDAPVATDRTIEVTLGGSYLFEIADFPATDEDKDTIIGVRIKTLPTAGTLTFPNGTPPALNTVFFYGSDFAVGGRNRITYRPASDATPATGYDTITFIVSTRNFAPANSDDLTITIDLVGAQTQEAATGAPTVTVPTNNDIVWNEDVVHTAAIAGVMEPNGINSGTIAWQWQQAAAPGGDYADIAGAGTATFTPLQAHVGRYVRVCASFRDHFTPPAEEMRCTAGNRIANTHDAPVTQNNTVFVPVGGSYTFQTGDFPFTDEDRDILMGINILSLTTAGTGELSSETDDLRNLNPPHSFGRSNVPGPGAQIGEVMYTPPNTATVAAAGYASFTYSVTTGRFTAARDSDISTITIDLVSATNIPATGAPTVPSASGRPYTEGVELTASTGTVADDNGIPTRSRLMWQWQQSATTATNTYENIDGATAAAFTPLNEHVGQYIRACLSFADGIGATETRCSAGALIAEGNSVNVPGTASEDMPYAFEASDFMLTGDGTLTSITIVTPIASDKGTLRKGSTAVTANTEVTAAELRNGDLTYYPPGNSAAASNFASFTFTVNDGNATRTMVINLAVSSLRLRLRLFLEGPLR